MKYFRIFFLLLSKSTARESEVSYPWYSTIQRNEPGLTVRAHLLLKQGLKIGYLPPSRYNCE